MAIRRFTQAVPPPRVLGAMAVLLALMLGLVAVAGRAGAADGPSVSVAPDSELPAEGSVMTVSGSGFTGGVYVGLGPVGLHDVASWFMQADLFTGDEWVGAGQQVDGAFSVDVTADAVFTSGSTTVDCRVTECGIYTWHDHTNFADRAQDTYTAVSFASEATTTTTTEAPTTTTTAPETTTTTVSETTTTTAPDGPVGVTGGYLDWGVKASFRSYVTGAAAGSISIDGGASTNLDGTYRFPVASGSGTADGVAFAAAFDGSVRFTGHGGELDMLLTGIEVEAEGDEGVLVADVTSHEQGTGDTAVFTDVELATLDLSAVTPGSAELTVTWADVAAALTEAGAPAFGGFYTAGTALDPLTVVLELEETTVPTTEPPTTTPDAASANKSAFVPGEDITVTGAGFLSGEQVEVWLFSEPQWVGTAITAADGSVTYSFTLPTDLPGGQHHVELRGISSGRVLSTAVFIVDAATAAVSAGSGTLPYTGGDSFPVGLAGLVLVGGGAGLAVLARRRTQRLGSSV